MGEVYLLTNLQTVVKPVREIVMGYDVKQGFILMKIKTDLKRRSLIYLQNTGESARC